MIVRGSLKDTKGRPIVAEIRFTSLSLRREHTIDARALSDASGNWATELSTDSAIRVRAYVPSLDRSYVTHQGGAQTAIADSGEICRPGPEVHVDLIAHLPAPIELEALLEHVFPLLDGVTPAHLTPDDMERLACMSGEPRGRIEALAASDALREPTHLDLPSLYALVRAGLPRDLRGLLRRPESDWAAAIRRAAEAKWVAHSVLDTLDATLARLRALALARLDSRVNGARGTPLGDALRASGVEAEASRRYLQLYRQHGNDDVTLRAKVNEALGERTAAAIERGLVFTALTLNQPKLVSHIGGANRDLPHPAMLAGRTETEWRALLDQLSIDGPEPLGDDAAARRRMFARVLRAGFVHAYPTQALAAEILRATDDSDLVTAARILERPEIDIRTEAIASLDLANVSTAVRTRLEQAQRLTRVTDDPEIVLAMMKADIGSAKAMANHSIVDLRALLPNVAPGTLARAHAKAKNIDGIVWGMGSKFLLDLQKTSTLSTKPMTKEALKKYPDLEKLFGSQSACACEECSAVDGPAAYLVDLIEFVRRHGKDAYKELVNKRRPELHTLKLSCANTLTAMPRVDLVIEALEARITGSAGAAATTNETTKSAAELAVQPERDALDALAAPLLTKPTYPWSLPFELYSEQSSTYLAEMGVTPGELLETFQQSDERVARAALGMPEEEWALLANESTSVAKAWNNQPIGPSLTNVAEILRLSGTTLAELDALLQSNYVKLDAPIILNPGPDCEPKTSNLLNVDDKFHSRFLRFVRTQRRLGWTADQLDWLIEESAGEITAATLMAATHIGRLGKTLNVPIEHALAIAFGPDKVLRPSAKTSISSPLYFDSTIVTLEDALGPLGINARDKVLAWVPGTDDPNKTDPRKLAQLTLLSRALGVSLETLAAIRGLQGVPSPFASPGSPADRVRTMLHFVDTVQRILASPLTTEAMLNVFGHVAPADQADRVSTIVAKIDSGLVAIDAESERARHGDPFDVVQRRLPSEIASATDLAAARAILDGGADAPYAKASSLFPFIPVASGAPHPLGTPPSTTLTEAERIAAVRDRYELVRAPLVDAGAARAKRLTIISVVASELQLASETARTLLELGATPSLQTLADSTTGAKDAVIELLLRQALVLNRLGLTQADVASLIKLIPTPQGLFGAPSSVVPFLDFVDVVRVQKEAPLGSPSLFDLLTTGPTPAGVAAATGWLDTDVQTLWPPNSAPMTWIRTAARKVTLARRVGQSVATVIDWAKSLEARMTSEQIVDAARAHAGTLEAWLVQGKAPRDRLREKQRRALVDFVAAKDFEGDVAILSQTMLFDVEAGCCELTSRVKHAISAVQAFVQQCLLRLETVTLDEGAAQQWKWMRFYRVWQANRRVFLFPENWVEPSLRDDKSPFFVELETTLGSGELTAEKIEKAYHDYLEKLDKVAKLEVVSMFRGHSDDKEVPEDIHVLGRSANAPYEWYSRRRERGWYWTPWEKIDVDIPADEAAIVVWNRRPWLFWFEKRPVQPVPAASDSLQTMPKAEAKLPQPKSTPPTTRVFLGWSEFRNGRWLGKRRSKLALEIPRTPDNVALVNLRSRLDRDALIIVAMDPATWINQAGSAPPDQWLKQVNYISGPSAAFRFDGCNAAPIVSTPKDWPVACPPGTTVAGHFGFRRAQPEKGGGQLSVLVATDPSAAKYPSNPATYGSSVVHLLAAPGSGADSQLDSYRLHAPTNDGQFYFTPFTHIDDKRAFFVDAAYAPKNLKDITAHMVPGNIVKVMGKVLATISQIVEADDGTIRDHMLLVNDDTPRWVDKLDAIVTTIEPDMADLPLPDRYRYFTFHHPYACDFVKRLERDGVKGLLRWNKAKDPAPAQQQSKSTFKSEYEPVTSNVVTPYPKDDVDFCVGSPYGIYNWELFFHGPHLIATKLVADGRYEDALEWLHYVFDPAPGSSSTEPEPMRYWNFKPFKEQLEGQSIQDVLMHLAQKKEFAASGECHTQTLVERVLDWRNNPFRPHLVARERPGAYSRAVVFTYLDALIGWADQLFRRDTLETVTQATQIYLLASRLLGLRPTTDMQSTQHPDAPTWDSVQKDLDAFSEALEPYVTAPSSAPSDDAPTFSMQPALVFCIPANQKVLAYHDTVADRLFKIRHCMNIKGVVRDLALFEPPLDPGQLVRLLAAGVDLSTALAEAAAPPPRYRFVVMAQKANELANEVRSLGASLLAALEKKDAEVLARMRSTQERQILELVRTIKAHQLDEASRGREALEASLEGAKIRHAFYTRKAAELMNPSEAAAVTLQNVAQVITQTTQVMYATSAIAALIPALTFGVSGVFGTPVNTASLDMEKIVGQANRDGAKILEAAASGLSFAASLSATLGSYQQRQDERRLQADVIAAELDQLGAQLAGARIREAIAERDLQNHERQVENAATIEAFMKEKFTNVELYDWMVSQLSGAYYQVYGLAFDMAKRAEAAFKHELGVDGAVGFIRAGQWQDRRAGLLAGEMLSADIRAMEAAYLEQNQRELQITKHVSLALLAPDKLTDLKKDGACTFEVPEWAFQVDFPNHYMRRIQSVALTIACVAGPHQGVPATLTLLKDTVSPQSTYSIDPKTKRTNTVAVQSIVTSHGQADTGMFDQREDPMYFPFERAGVVSTWRLEIGSKKLQTFDWASISDVLLHLRYTARDGGQKYADAVIDDVKKKAGEGTRLFSARGDFSDAYFKLFATNKLEVGLKPTHFPFVTRGKKVTCTKVMLKFLWEPSIDEKTALTVKLGTEALTGTGYEWTSSTVVDATTGGSLAFEVSGLPGSIMRTVTEGGVTVQRLDPTKVRDIIILARYESAP